MPKPKGNKRIGLGISACSMFSGAPYYPFASAATVKMHDDGTATLFTGATEMGQGCDTTLAQVAAQVLGLELEDIRLVSGDTELCPIDLGSFLSGGALVTGNAVAKAAANARDQLIDVAARMLEANPADLKLADKQIFVAGAPEKSLSYAQLIANSIQKRGGDSIVGKGFQKPVADADYYPSLARVKGRWTEAYGFAAQLAEVEVDLETAQVKVLKVITVHDCGFPLNVQIVEGQVEGCISMGLGQALSETVLLEQGMIFNPSFLEYSLPTSRDTPNIQLDLVHSFDPKGPFGAKEAGEGTVAGMLAAVANAVYDASGVRIKSLPITPYLLSKESGRKVIGLSS
jgi:4-hydroxybenzoyl-CoA reductase subunit alpha